MFERLAPLVWDAHSNLPVAAGVDLEVLALHRSTGFNFVSLNVGYDPVGLARTLQGLAWFRHAIAASPRLQLVGSVAELDAAVTNRRLAIAFDIEGALCLGGRPEMVHLFAALGVRQMALAYNRSNEVAAGCYDADTPLPALGRAVVRELNAAGVVIDCSHGGRRCSLDIMAASTAPVVFSHANVAALVEHPRNVTDAQIDACAATGGVIGIAGYSRFLGVVPSDAEAIAEHVDYVAQRAGVAHVGIGWDWGYPEGDVPRLADPARFDWWFPDAAANRAQGLRPEEAYTPLAEIRRLPAALARRGYSDEDIAAVLGGNFRRVAERVWPQPTS